MEENKSGGSEKDLSSSSVARTMKILEILTEDSALSLTEISKRSGIHKSTVLRILGVLISIGYVFRNSDTDHYSLTAKLDNLINVKAHSNYLINIANDKMEEMARITGETVHLAIQSKGDLYYLIKIESTQRLRVATASEVGENAPMYCTGLGKAILAWSPRNEQFDYIENHNFHRFTDTTIIDAKQFINELVRIKERGYAFDLEEHEKGVVCVAAPVLSQKNIAIAAISISGPSVRMDKEILHNYSILVQEIASQISNELRDSFV